MRPRTYFAALILFIAVFLAGCNSAEQKPPPQIAADNKPTPVQAPPNDGVRRITVQEAQDMLAKGQAVIIAQGHVKGAKLIPFTEIQNHLNELPKDKFIITYCS